MNAIRTHITRLKRRIFPLFLFLVASNSYGQFYSGSYMEFGKNRIQHDEPRLWTWYKFEKFNTYFYKGGQELAVYVSKNAAGHIAEIEKLFDYTLDDKIEFIIYNKQSEFKQSNLGLISEEQYNVGGVTRIVGSKVILYFEGDHAKLERQMRMGIAEVLINQMMYGGNMKEMLKNSTFLALPDWYIQGLVSYVANKWDVEIDTKVRDGLMAGKYSKFNQLTGQDATYAGHSVWNYIADTYGENVISNLLYMSKVSRNIESSFLFVLGTSLRNLTYEWENYYLIRYSDLDKLQLLPTIKPLLEKPKATRVYSQFRLSPDGKRAIYVTNEMGQYKVWLYDIEKQKAKRILKREPKLDRINDHSYPLLAWHPSGLLFSIITEEKGEIRLTYYTLENGKKEMIKLFNFEKVLDFSYSEDGKKLAIAAINKGQSDIYVFNIAGGGVEQITNDIFDDINPRFLNNSEKIVFSSNRPGDSLKTVLPYTGKLSPYKDLFIYNYKTRSNILKRVTESPFINETHAYAYDSTRIAYLGDDNGIKNRYVASFDSVIAYVDTVAHYRYITRTAPLTNYSRNILEQDINSKSGKIAEIVFHSGKYYMYVHEMSVISGQNIQLKNTPFRDAQIKSEMKRVSDTTSSVKVNEVKVIKTDVKVIKDTSGIDIDNYVFDSPSNKKKEEKPKEDPKPEIKPSPDTVQTARQEFVLPVMRNYNVFYSTDYVVSQIDNSFLNANYQRFTGGHGEIYLNPGFTGLFKIGLSDLFEDKRIVTGFRISDMHDNEFMISYENRLKRWDKQVVLHRQTVPTVVSSALARLYTHEGRFNVKYPFNEVASLRFSTNLRMDKTVVPAYDLFTLNKEDVFEYWASAKLEYVFDNTIKKGLNLYNGLRYKIFAEYIRQLNGDQPEITIVGVDFRHYQKLHRDIIWANRLAASTSIGTHKLIYYMGGVDNWLTPRFNYSTPIATDQNYVFQTLATPLRGHYQNWRNGNSFVLLNSEIRIPLFRYLMNRPIKSDFINNFQVVVFGDVGTAWTGKSPYDDSNSLNTVVISSPGNPIVVIIKNKRDPIVGCFGYGVRSRLLGYFVRLDWAWGIEDGQVLPKNGNPENGKKPTMVYLSFSLDF
ncbi:MAG: hypothetical protein AB1458_03870 [Bacteroidota bacterium]